MRIVSQNREASLKFDDCIMTVEEDRIWLLASKDIKFQFARYDSNERAKEVFEDIHKAYAPVYTMSSGMTDEQIKEMVVQSSNVAVRNIVSMPQESYITAFDNYVYYMPEK